MAAELTTPKQRVEAELSDLEGKGLKLAGFLTSDAFAALGDEQQTLLREQLRVMGEYAAILEARLRVWGD